MNPSIWSATAMTSMLSRQRHIPTLPKPMTPVQEAFYMRHYGAGSAPLNDHTFNATRSSMKLSKCVACDVAIVARTMTEPKSRNVTFCFIYDCDSEFAIVIDQNLASCWSHRGEMQKLVEKRDRRGDTARTCSSCDKVSPSLPNA